MNDDQVPLQVVETPAEALKRLALAPDVPPAELWLAIADAVRDVTARLDDLKDQIATTNRRLTRAGLRDPDGG